MRKTIIALLLILVAILSGCETGTDIDAVNEDGSPIWTTEVPQSNRYLYGVGRAKLANSINSENAAESAARADLARKIQTSIHEAQSSYTADSTGAVAEAYERITVETVNITMRNVVVEQNWTAPDGMVWALVSFRMKDLDDLYELAANDYLNQVEARKAETERNLVDLLTALSEVEDENASLIASEGEAIAKEIIDQCDEVLGSVDATALASLIAAVYDSAE